MMENRHTHLRRNADEPNCERPSDDGNDRSAQRAENRDAGFVRGFRKHGRQGGG
ncbi:hypothetical protein Mapa_016832 [Marchantia paleacea]|nr:hypothetical protein Mapa_016832 [Marchantia paleacea]